MSIFLSWLHQEKDLARGGSFSQVLSHLVRGAPGNNLSEKIEELVATVASATSAEKSCYGRPDATLMSTPAAALVVVTPSSSHSWIVTSATAAATAVALARLPASASGETDSDVGPERHEGL